MASVDGQWTLGIGDPSLGGWITVGAYFVAAWAAWRAQRRGEDGRGHTFWLALMSLMLLLGVNKQLDLQTAFTQVGRDMALAQGWYERRHGVQIAFIGVLGLGAVAGLFWLFWRLWPLPAPQVVSLCGLGFLGAFVVARAASFHHVDILLASTVLGLRWNWIFELSGIGLVALGALAAARRRRPPPRAGRRMA